MSIADAVGTSCETFPREVLQKEPITDMIGKGKYHLQPGQWTDDSSMAFLVTESLLTHHDWKPQDQNDRFYNWYQDGHLSSNGKCFDIGKQTLKSILGNLKEKRDYAPEFIGNTGNGGLMRLLPVPLYYSFDTKLALEMSSNASKVTHHVKVSLESCKYFAGLILGALNGASKEELLSPYYCPIENYWKDNKTDDEFLDSVMKGDYKKKSEDEVFNKGSVVHSLEAALWGFYNTDNFKDGVLKIVNLGDDSDSVGAIYGQLAGVFYGFKGIPENWRKQLALAPLIEMYSKELYETTLIYKEGSKPKQSKHFETCTKILLYLEDGYRKIMRRTDPCPQRYKSMEEFDKDIEIFKEGISQFMETEEKDFAIEMWNEFEKRLEKQNRPELKNYLNMKNISGGLFKGVILKK